MAAATQAHAKVRGVILAGGHGTRLLPLTRVTNKHLLPVGRKPMIFHPIDKLREAGVTDILIVTGTEHMGDMVRLLGSGREYGVSFTFRVQDEAGGIAQALALAETFAAGHKLVVILGDNIFNADLNPFVEKFAAGSGGAMLLLKQVADPERFGVAAFGGPDSAGQRAITHIVEKPKVPPSDYAVTGVYFYDAQVFDIIRRLTPSARGEFEITDVNNAYLQRGQLDWAPLPGFWTDAGTHESLDRAHRLVLGEDPGQAG